MRRNIAILALAAVLACGYAASASAQLADKKGMTLAEAKKLLAAAEDAATKGKAHMGLAVLDEGGHLVAFERMDGASLVTVEFAQEKARTSVMYKAPTDVFSGALTKGNNAILGLPAMAPFGGGFPLKVGDQVVGAIGCSGGNTPTQDSDVCKAAADTLGK
ncbi:MAG TPA: heme-binding protein [Stellaceae bacterium]